MNHFDFLLSKLTDILCASIETMFLCMHKSVPLFFSLPMCKTCSLQNVSIFHLKFDFQSVILTLGVNFYSFIMLSWFNAVQVPKFIYIFHIAFLLLAVAFFPSHNEYGMLSRSSLLFLLGDFNFINKNLHGQKRQPFHFVFYDLFFCLLLLIFFHRRFFTRHGINISLYLTILK